MFSVMPYTKLDAGIIFSTVWREPHTTVRVWIAMLAMKDRRGEVLASIPGLADAARVTIAECEAALTTFRAVDPYSRTQDNDGRRIEDIDGGWLVLNHDKYRGLEDSDDRRRKAALRAKRYRERKEKERHAVTRDESSRDAESRPITQTSRQADADADADALTTTTKDLTTSSRHAVTFADAWSCYPSRGGHGNSRVDAEKCWNARVRAGVPPAELLAGTQRYAAYCDALHKTGTEYVKLGRTFFGPGEHWREAWTIPPPTDPTGIDWTKPIPEE